MSNFFRRPVPIEFDITIGRDAIVGTVVSTLNKMAEARFDGQNTQYVNNMQPEIDFEQDRNLVYGYYNEAIGNITRRIEPYVSGCEDVTEGTIGNVFHLSMPENWRNTLQQSLKTKMENYLVHYIICQWLEKVSVSDTEYTTAKANKLLGEIKWTCELRKGVVHRIWNGTY